MSRFLSFLLCLGFLITGCQHAPSTPPLVAQTTNANWEKDITAFEALDQAKAPPAGGILFIGSSSIRLWKSLEQDFANHKVLNRGFGGSQIIDSVYYAPRVVFPYRPKQIIFYAGGNDINAGKEPDELLRDFKAFATAVHRELPRTKIAFISIAPNPARWKQIERVRDANRLIQDYCRSKSYLSYIDVHNSMLNAEGQPKEGIYVADQLHMNEKGYAIWKEIVGPALLKP